MNFFRDRSPELLDAAGALRKWAWPVEDTGSAGHLMGTCRMAAIPGARSLTSITGRTMFQTFS